MLRSPFPAVTPEERPRLLRAVATFMRAIGAGVVARTVGSALFLSRYEPSALSSMYIASAALLLVVALAVACAGFVIVRRDTMFADISQLGINGAAYDVMPDGQSFIMVRPIGAGSPPMFVLNGFDELSERMAQAAKP